jgi:hypothetical protein
MIAFNIDLNRIDQARTFTGKTGRRYLSFILIDGPDQFGNAGQVVPSISREKRAGGGKGEVVGTWKHLGVAKAGSQAESTRRNEGLFNSPARAFDAAQCAADNGRRKISL